MKTTILLAILAFFSIMGCRKDDENPQPNVYSEENPLDVYLKNTGFNQRTQIVYYTDNQSANFWESGYLFKPKVKGKINAITLKIPDNEKDVRVTIWDVSTQLALKTIIVPEVFANVEVKHSIEPMMIDPSKEYLISFNGNDCYIRKKTDETATTYPVDAGNISILAFHRNNSTIQTYPITARNNFYAGDLSIVFQQTE